MDAKTIVAVVLVAFIIGGFIFLQIKNRKKYETKGWAERKKLRPFTLWRCFMNKQRTVDSKVLSILRECPETRYDDMQLILCYYNRYSYLKVGDLSLEDIVNNYKGYGLPCFETIRRSRQRVQSLFPELSRQCSGCDSSIRVVIEIE